MLSAPHTGDRQCLEKLAWEPPQTRAQAGVPQPSEALHPLNRRGGAVCTGRAKFLLAFQNVEIPVAARNLGGWGEE